MLNQQVNNISNEEEFLDKIEKNKVPKMKTNLQLFINGKRVNIPENLAGMEIQENLEENLENKINSLI